MSAIWTGRMQEDNFCRAKEGDMKVSFGGERLVCHAKASGYAQV